MEETLETMKMQKATHLLRVGVRETLANLAFPREQRALLRSKQAGRNMRVIRRWKRVNESFRNIPDA